MKPPESLETPVEPTAAPPPVTIYPPTPMSWRLGIAAAILALAIADLSASGHDRLARPGVCRDSFFLRHRRDVFGQPAGRQLADDCLGHRACKCLLAFLVL